MPRSSTHPSIASSVVIALLLVAAVLGGCADDPVVAPPRTETEVEGRTVTRRDPALDGRFLVGVLVARTGPLAAADARVLAGLEAQVAALQARGVSAEFVPELDVIDTESDLPTATTAAGRLLDRGVDVLVVGCDPEIARNATLAAGRSGRLVLAPCVGDAGVEHDGTLFAFGPDDEAQGRLLAEQAVGVGLDTAAVVSELTPADGSRVCRAFVARYQELGGRVLAELEQPLGVGADVSARNLARLDRPDVVISCVTTSSVATLVSTLRELGIGTPVLATAAADGAGIVDPTVAYLQPAALRPPTPAVQALLDAGVPGTSAVTVLSALALELLVGAAIDGGSVDGPTLATGLRSPATAARADGLGFDEAQRLVLPLGLVPATGG
jgi:ABC-type branched-subunit amino acid transport system substrate-binding protein